MSGDQVIINQTALREISASLKKFGSEYYDALERARVELLSNNIEWDDEDSSQLVSAIMALMEGAKSARSAAENLCKRIDSKLEAVDALHRMKI